jgi:hypothetical protein
LAPRKGEDDILPNDRGGRWIPNTANINLALIELEARRIDVLISIF